MHKHKNRLKRVLLLFSCALYTSAIDSAQRNTLFEKMHDLHNFFINKKWAFPTLDSYRQKLLFLGAGALACFGLACYIRPQSPSPEQAQKPEPAKQSFEDSNNISFLSRLAEGRLPEYKTRYVEKDFPSIPFSEDFFEPELFKELEKDPALITQEGEKADILLSPQTDPEQSPFSKPDLFKVGTLYSHIFDLSKKNNFSDNKATLIELYDKIFYDLFNNDKEKFNQLLIEKVIQKKPIKSISPYVKNFINNIFQDVVIVHKTLGYGYDALTKIKELIHKPKESYDFTIVEPQTTELTESAVNIASEKKITDFLLISKQPAIIIEYLDKSLEAIKDVPLLTSLPLIIKNLNSLIIKFEEKIMKDFLRPSQIPINYCFLKHYSSPIDALIANIENMQINLRTFTFLIAQKSSAELKEKNKSLGQHIFEIYKEKGLHHLTKALINHNDVYTILGLSPIESYTPENITSAFIEKFKKTDDSYEKFKLEQAHNTIKTPYSKKIYDLWLVKNLTELETLAFPKELADANNLNEFNIKQLNDNLQQILIQIQKFTDSLSLAKLTFKPQKIQELNEYELININKMLQKSMGEQRSALDQIKKQRPE